jgi:hypothetical protein
VKSKSSLAAMVDDLPPITPMFGFPITDITERENTEMPSVVKMLTNFILSYGLDEEGVFKLDGDQEEILSLQEKFDKNMVSDLSRLDVHTICGILKAFFARHPSPIIPVELSNKLDEILQRTNKKYEAHVLQSMQQISAFLKALLQPPIYKTLRRLFYVLFKVYENKIINHTSVRSLNAHLNNKALFLPFDLFRALIVHFTTIFDDYDPASDLF